jgi:hypothetical protein
MDTSSGEGGSLTLASGLIEASSPAQRKQVRTPSPLRACGPAGVSKVKHGGRACCGRDAAASAAAARLLGCPSSAAAPAAGPAPASDVAARALEGLLAAGVGALDRLALAYSAEAGLEGPGWLREGSGESPGPPASSVQPGAAAQTAPRLHPLRPAPCCATPAPPSTPPSEHLLLQLQLVLAALLPRLLQQQQQHSCISFCLFKSRLQPALLKPAIELAWNLTAVPQRPQLYRAMLQHCSSSAAVAAMSAAFEPLLAALQQCG